MEAQIIVEFKSLISSKIKGKKDFEVYEVLDDIGVINPRKMIPIIVRNEVKQLLEEGTTRALAFQLVAEKYNLSFDIVKRHVYKGAELNDKLSTKKPQIILYKDKSVYLNIEAVNVLNVMPDTHQFLSIDFDTRVVSINTTGGWQLKYNPMNGVCKAYAIDISDDKLPGWSSSNFNYYFELREDCSFDIRKKIKTTTKQDL